MESIGNQNRLRLNFDLNERGKGKQDDKEISEEIDNPDNCKDLKKAAERYLDCGEVYYQIKMVPVRSAIQHFIESH